MVPTILIVGATGNTGRSVVETLSNFIQSNRALSGYRLLALTRSSDSPAAQKLAKQPGVEIAEKSWMEITPEWLRENEVVKVFIAPHSELTQFVEESKFHLAALQGGVKYVVRISTTAPNVRPDCPAYHGRQHWAVEALLSSPEFANLQWTSLQPNSFAQFYLWSAATLINQYRKTGKQETLRLAASEDASVAIVDSDEIGIFAAHLLALDDPAVHNRAKYVVNGPEDITGAQIVKMVEEYIGVPVENVIFKDMSFVEYLAANSPHKAIMLSMRRSLETCWEGKCSSATTSKELLEIAAPKRTPSDVLESLLKS